MSMARKAVVAWTTSYKQSWETLDAELFVSLFTEDAVYYPTPFAEPYHFPELSEHWNSLKKMQKDNHIEFTVWQAEDDTAVVRWDGQSTRLPSMETNRGSGIFFLQFAQDGKCRLLQQWQHWHRQLLPLRRISNCVTELDRHKAPWEHLWLCAQSAPQ